MPETGGSYYDRQEVRNPADREASTFHALPGLLRHALDNAPYFAEQLAGIEPDAIASRGAGRTGKHDDGCQGETQHRTHRKTMP